MKFDPTRHGFVRITEPTMGNIATYEYGCHVAVGGKIDPLRLNLFMTRDGDYTHIWSGLMEPHSAEGLFNKSIADVIDFADTYNEKLFDGYIATTDEAEVVFHCLRINERSSSLPQVLRCAPHDIRCEQL